MTQRSVTWEALAAEALASGQACFQRGDHANAVEAYSAALEGLDDAEGMPTEQRALVAQLYSQRAHAQFIRRELAGATDDYSQALHYAPRLAEAYAYRGLIAYQTGKSIGALADYSAAIELYEQAGITSAATGQLLAEAYFNRGNAQYQRRDYPGAIADYSQALVLLPDLVDAQIYRGVARYQYGDLAGAAADYAQAMAHPAVTPTQHAAIHYNRGLLLRQRGDLFGAIAAYNAALALMPNDADCLMNRGNARAEQGDLAGALEDFSGALRLNPWLEDGFNTRGMARLEAGDLQGAVEDFSRAIKVAPQTRNVHFNRACARLQSGDFAGAVEDFSVELGRHTPGLKGRVETREQRAEIYNNRGLAYHYQGALDAALEDYTRSLQQLRLAGTPESVGERLASTLLNRGLAYRDQALAQPQSVHQPEMLRAALADLEQAVALAPDAALREAAGEYLEELQREGKGRVPLP